MSWQRRYGKARRVWKSFRTSMARHQGRHDERMSCGSSGCYTSIGFPKPSIMERFASAHGFKKDGDGRFFHSNGEWIAKTVGMRIPWERRKASGDLVVYYWAEDHCLDQDPLQLEADVWHLIKNSPGIYA